LPDEPPQNPTLLSELAINTAVSPSGNLLWSPRLGVSYDPSGRGATYLRGGIGLFAGRPAYNWLREGYLRTGLEVLRLACFGDDVPSFTLDPANQPVECGQPENPDPVVAYFNPAFRYPRNLKIALGVDHRLPSGFVGTVDLLYTRGVDQLDLVDANLLPQSGTASGEGGRALYGTVDPADGTTQPNRRSPEFGPVIEIRNGRGDRSYSLAAQLQKRFAQGTELSAAYTYTDARDRISNPADLAYSNLGTTPLDGSWESRNLRTSHWSIPHKVTLVATVNLPLEFRLGAIYTGQSGHPYSYIVRGDANADGVDNITGARHNDLVYVPTDASDITLADPAEYELLEAVIQQEECLATQRGRILERNSCRNPWINSLQARLTKMVPTTWGQSLQLTADLFNVLNFLDSDWGLVRSTVEDFGFQQRGGRTSLLEIVGYDTVNDRGVYRVLQPGRRRIDLEASRWRLQLSARYVF
jgi:hypothetical protein